MSAPGSRLTPPLAVDTDGEGYPRARPANSLTKSDLALLKVAHDEELSENKESATSKKHVRALLAEADDPYVHSAHALRWLGGWSACDAPPGMVGACQGLATCEVVDTR